METNSKHITVSEYIRHHRPVTLLLCITASENGPYAAEYHNFTVVSFDCCNYLHIVYGYNIVAYLRTKRSVEVQLTTHGLIWLQFKFCKLQTEISVHQLAFSKTSNLNKYKTYQNISVKLCRDVG